MMIDKAITSTVDVDALCCKGALTPYFDFALILGRH